MWTLDHASVDAQQMRWPQAERLLKKKQPELADFVDAALLVVRMAQEINGSEFSNKYLGVTQSVTSLLKQRDAIERASGPTKTSKSTLKDLQGCVDDLVRCDARLAARGRGEIREPPLGMHVGQKSPTLDDTTLPEGTLKETRIKVVERLREVINGALVNSGKTFNAFRSNASPELS
jgi:hypothetical protein